MPGTPQGSGRSRHHSASSQAQGRGNTPGETQSVSPSATAYPLDPMDCSPPGSSDQGILQARILEWAAMPSFQGIFPKQGPDPGLLHGRRILYRLSQQKSPIRRREIYESTLTRSFHRKCLSDNRLHVAHKGPSSQR